MVRKVLWFLFPAVLGVLAALQWQDALRYLKIRKISAGEGHPEVVPAKGKPSYVKPSAAKHRGHAG